MKIPGVPVDESDRQAALCALEVLDTPAEECFDRITRVAQRHFQVPIALVSLVDARRLWFKSRQGLGASETPRDISFCGHAILGDDIFHVPNALEDPRFADNPSVTGAPHIRFYAGAPLHAPGGARVGTLCIIDSRPRQLSAEDFAMLRDLADSVDEELEHARDITERKKLERMKDEFVSTVSHELRTPLTSIRGALSLLLGKYGAALPEKGRLLLDMAKRNSERLTLLVNDLLDLEKIESGSLDFDFRALDLATIVQHALAANADYARQYGVRLRVAELPQVATVWGDEHRLLQVFGNLLSNAIKYSPKESEVVVSVRRRDARYRVSVQDRGLGIPDEFRSRIFQRFAQADSSDTREKGGAGLGLSISKAIVERHGGSIDFVSEFGAGSEFFVELSAWRETEP